VVANSGVRGQDGREQSGRRAGPALLFIAVIALIGLNLRAALGAVPPLLPDIDDELHLSSAGAGALTSVAVVSMGLCAPLGQRLSARIGVEPAVGCALVVLALGSALRLVPGTVFVYVTGALVGGAMGAASALVPAIVGQHLPRISGLATGVYSASLALGVAIAAGSAVPMERALGSWRAALAVWGAVAAMTALCWWVVQRTYMSTPAKEVSPAAGSRRLPWTSQTAWLVSLFLASQMVVGFSGLAWIPPLYVSLGFTGQEAAGQLVVFQLVQLITMLSLPALSDHVRDRRPLLMFGLVCTCAGLSLVLIEPTEYALPAMLLFGAGVGSGSTLGLVLITDSAANSNDAARLGAMVLLISFLAAACGPALVGALSDLTGNLDSGFVALLLLTALMVPVSTRYRPGRTLHD
jgi:CP family cyanate transporter-like MFS transporter